MAAFQHRARLNHTFRFLSIRSCVMVRSDCCGFVAFQPWGMTLHEQSYPFRERYRPHNPFGLLKKRLTSPSLDPSRWLCPRAHLMSTRLSIPRFTPCSTHTLGGFPKCANTSSQAHPQHSSSPHQIGLSEWLPCVNRPLLACPRVMHKQRHPCRAIVARGLLFTSLHLRAPTKARAAPLEHPSMPDQTCSQRQCTRPKCSPSSREAILAP